jgi:hypothetical protein
MHSNISTAGILSTITLAMTISWTPPDFAQHCCFGFKTKSHYIHDLCKNITQSNWQTNSSYSTNCRHEKNRIQMAIANIKLANIILVQANINGIIINLGLSKKAAELCMA